ncbi:hypothetical protein PHPALM_30513 [Phytophthora palmivora]|uniref:ATP-binding cassette (ABC) Superfamily n=1 Tax=Phytophthora palmivora TaxID=4796 RepID=A0A2P4X524_9STRA|nr:hypothetical protein PHPALM_30513 [Phytophthora palmivora]
MILRRTLLEVAPQSFEAKAPPTRSATQNLTLDEGKARAQAAKTASSKRADEGAASAKKRAAPGSTASSEEAEQGGAPRDLGEQQERYQLAQLQGASAPPTLVYPRGYFPPDAGSGSPMFLDHLTVSTLDTLLVAPMSVCAARTTPNSLDGIYESQEESRRHWGGSSPRGVQPENTTTQTQGKDLFWRWVSLKNFTVHELKELREDCLLSYAWASATFVLSLPT